MKGAAVFDVAIIGAGVTGLAAGMYAGRLNLRGVVLGAATGSERGIGGVLTLTDVVENYPGFRRLSGAELTERLREHLLDYQEKVQLKPERVERLEADQPGCCFALTTPRGSYHTKTLIFATGTRWDRLPMEGAERLENRGVHYCALCDGPLYQDKVVAVVGGGDSAAKEALLLATYAHRVLIINRKEDIAPEPVNYDRVRAESRIEVVNHTNVERIEGERKVEAVAVDRPLRGSQRLVVDAVFGAIGSTPLSGLAASLGVQLNSRREIVIDHQSCATSVAGVFAAGDVVDSGFKQAIVGAAQGVVAAHSAYEYVHQRRVNCWGEQPS
jgi:thioredoxin reductase (NADPH)